MSNATFCALGQEETRLDSGWEMISVAANAFVDPAALRAAALSFQPAAVPGTVAMLSPQVAVDATRHDAARQDPPRLDAQDHWYRVTLPAVNANDGARRVLCFDGLATLADVWLDDTCLFSSDNMFVTYACDVTTLLETGRAHVLSVRFRALLPVLQVRRPRGRWPTRLVSQKHLRFVRTSLLGYMPGWFPDTPIVGPWRDVRLVVERGVALEHVQLRARLEGTVGVLSVQADCRYAAHAAVTSAHLRLNSGDESALSITSLGPDSVRVSGELRCEGVHAWWPHTHGEPALHDVALVIDGRSFELGRVGFRALELWRGHDGQGFALQINGRAVFMRGACWSPLDATSIHASAAEYRRALEQVREAGFNVLRVSGVSAYEADAFYGLCDELGICVWQDFMFANLDYPVEDAGFAENCRIEALQLLDRLGARCSLVVLCGGSEVMQQAAMMGLPREQWSSALFDEVLPSACHARNVDAIYVPSTPSGGALPFHVNSGVGHYYGVGAYLRPLNDVRISDVRFASECLAFSNVEEGPDTVGVAPHDPGASWHFGDVTDHYVHVLFGVDVQELKRVDVPRYLDLCRAATGEVMAFVMQHWRREHSLCGGALVWLLRDPQPGPGWGVIDHRGVPKSAFYFLKRACAPRALWFSDEGVNGLLLHLHNETSHRLRGHVEITLFRQDAIVVEHAKVALDVAPWAHARWNVEAAFGRFADASYAYRFGPPGHRLAFARLALDEPEGELPAPRAFHLVPGLEHARDEDVALSARVERDALGREVIHVGAKGFAQTVSIDAPGFALSDNYFHVEPGGRQSVTLRDAGPNPAGNQRLPVLVRVRALNTSQVVEVTVSGAREG